MFETHSRSVWLQFSLNQTVCKTGEMLIMLIMLFPSFPKVCLNWGDVNNVIHVTFSGTMGGGPFSKNKEKGPPIVPQRFTMINIAIFETMELT